MWIKRLIYVAVLAAAFSMPPAQAWGGHDSPSNCERSAGSMLHACRYDARDDLNTTVASCQMISDRADRWSCYVDANTARGEDLEECGDVYEARVEACDVLDEDRYDPDPLLDPGITFIDPDDVPEDYSVNPFVSVEAGHTYVLRAGEEEEETVVVHVTDESREILGVLCRVVVDIVVEVSDEGDGVEYEAVEATDDWFAQDTVGNVYYCGEISRNYEDGVLRDIDGSFEAGIEYAKAGTLVQAFPVAGEAHRQEFSPGEAEDIVQYVSLDAGPTDEGEDENPNFPCAGKCLQTFDFAPIDPESTEYKYYLPGTGFVLAIAMEDEEITGEREELICVGDSLDILSEPQCEIDDPEALLEELCKLSPDAFCADDEEGE